VLRSLARAPADRYTAAAFADAIDAARHAPPASPASQQETGEVKAPRARSRWRAGCAVAVLFAVLAVAWLLLRRAGARPSLDASLVAVAPFDVLDSRLERWRGRADGRVAELGPYVTEIREGLARLTAEKR